MEQISSARGKMNRGDDEKENAMVVDGAALQEIFKKNKEEFYKATKHCKSVLVCRASPLQKVMFFIL